MISRPTTDQLILDCRRELLEVIAPSVSDPALQLALGMLENVLRNAATRVAHEIAWMTSEAEGMLRYSDEVAAALGDPTELGRAVGVARAEARGGLHLGEAVADYSLAGEAFSCALEAAMAARDESLIARGVALLESRHATEAVIKGEWGMIGRT